MRDSAETLAGVYVQKRTSKLFGRRNDDTATDFQRASADVHSASNDSDITSHAHYARPPTQLSVLSASTSIFLVCAMSDEPLFDPSLKKRKKKQVAFSEDPLGADADPTTPAPTTIDNVTTNGDTVDMGPTTMHEQMAQNGASGAGDDEAKVDEDSMFADLKKKKKKKKDIPMDLVCITRHLYFVN